MKKIILPLVILCLSMSMISQTQRTILYEEFTGENCGPCAATNPSLTTLVHTTGNFPNKVLLIRYQSPIPSAPGIGSLYVDNSTEPNARISYYSVPFAPYARFDGIVLPYPNVPTDDGHASLLSQQYINDSAIVNSPFALNLGYVINATQDSVTVTATITAAQAYSAITSGSLKLQVAMEEAAIHFSTAPGSNGEIDFYDIMRKMMPSTNGTTLNDNWVTAATQTITIKEAIPTYIHDKSQLAFVGFIQDNGSKRVHQAAYAAPLPLTSLDAGINNFTVPTNCSNTISNITVNLENHGVQTITTCTVNYQLDNNPVQTMPYNGSLGTASWVSMVIPTFTASLGQHVFRCYTTNPNGSIDGQPSNDTSTTNFTIYGSAATPVVEGFETTSSLPSALWDISHTSAGGADFQVTSAAASSGTKSIMVNNFNNVSGNNSVFQTAWYYNMITLASPTLSFDAAYQQKASSNADKLQIFTSIDCGNTWVSRRVITGATLASLAGGTGTNPYVPTPSQFTTYTVNINGVSTNQNVLFRWEFLADPPGPGNNFYLDNINIIDASNGIKNIDMNAELNLYPNPNNGSFVIAFVNSAPATSVITVTNILGEVVLTQSNLKMTNEINLQGISKGTYVVKVQTPDKTYIRKIIINN